MKMTPFFQKWHEMVENMVGTNHDSVESKGFSTKSGSRSVALHLCHVALGCNKLFLCIQALNKHNGNN